MNNTDLYNINFSNNNNNNLLLEYLHDKNTFLEKIHNTNKFNRLIKFLYDDNRLDDVIYMNKYNDEIFNILLEYSMESNKIIYKNIYYIVKYKRFDIIDKYLKWSKNLNNDIYNHCINMISCNILDIYYYITDFILFLDYFKSKNILNNHFISHIIIKLKSRFDIILILDNYVTDYTDLIYHITNLKLDNIHIILEYLINNNIEFNNLNEDFDHEKFFRYIIINDIYYNILDEYIETNSIINKTNNELKTILEDYEISYKHYIKYFIKHLYNKLNDHTKKVINDTYINIFANDRYTCDFLVSEYVYHISIHDLMKNYIKSRIDNHVNNIYYITYYLKYFYIKDDVTDTFGENTRLINKYINPIFSHVISFLSNNDIYNKDLFDYIDNYIDDIINNNIGEFDLTLLDEKTNKLIFNILYYYYKFNKDNINKIIKLVENRLYNINFFNLFVKYDILLDDLYDDMIYNHIINLNKFNIDIIKYVIRNYNDDYDEKIRLIKLKLFDYIDNRYIIEDQEHKLIIKYNNNKFNNYIKKYNEICEKIDNELNLGRDVAGLIYTYGYL